MGEHHVGLEHYLFLLRGAMGPGEMLQRMHRHLLEGCDECRDAWEDLLDGQRRSLRELLAAHDEPIPFDPTPPPETPLHRPSPYESAFSGAASELTRAASRLTTEKRSSRRVLDALLAIPAAEREQRIIRSRKRFRSPALAHLLVEESRQRVRCSWQEALDLLELARLVILWSGEDPASDRQRSLALRVEAHRANAHRVAGRLGEAERRFLAIRHQSIVDPVADPSLDAELASLEASLRWDQARHDEAMALLDDAELIYREIGEREGLARVLIQRASVARELERGDQALADLERARRLLDPERQGFLFLFTVVGLVPILLDAERYEEARQVLAEAEEVSAAAGEPWWALRLRHLQGRVRLGLGDLDAAERLLDEARAGFRDQDLPYESAGVSLDLALLFLRQGRTAEVRRAARQVEPIFRALGVERAGLATLKLLAEADAADASAVAWVGQLRGHLRAARPPRRARQKPS